MSTIAWELDEKEKKLMMESGVSGKDYLNFMQVRLSFNIPCGTLLTNNFCSKSPIM